jgi:hypothetical protein
MSIKYGEIYQDKKQNYQSDVFNSNTSKIMDRQIRKRVYLIFMKIKHGPCKCHQNDIFTNTIEVYKISQ